MSYIWTMSKVGTQGVLKGVRKFQNEAVMLHTISPPENGKVYCANGVWVDATQEEIDRRKKYRDAFEQGGKAIVTLVRDPIDRALSAFFYALRHDKNSDELYVLSAKDKGEVNRLRIIGNDKIKDIFLEKFDHDFALTWFDKELKEYGKVDVYTAEFNKKRGYTLIEGHNRFMVIRLDKLKDVDDEAFKKLYGRRVNHASPNNADKFEYFTVYKEFKRDVKFSRDFTNYIYDSKFAKHFWTDEELRGLKERWS